MGYNFTTQWLKGTDNQAADALSRHPHMQPADGDDLAEQETDTHHHQAATYPAMSITQIRMSAVLPSEQENLHLQELRLHAEQDQSYQTLKSIITEGFPDQKTSLPDLLKQYWSIRDRLSIDDDLIVYGCRLLIPTSLRATLLSRLHDAHQGIARSQARARLTIYWPGIDQDIETFVKGCLHCQDRLPSNVKEPMTSKQVPERPFQQIAADFASYGGKQFLVLVDCKTDWPDIIAMGRDTTATKLAVTLRDHFCRTAASDLLWSDGGPQFTSRELATFLKTWGVAHAMSSPHYPQSNGKAEATVKAMKKLISAAWSGRSISSHMHFYNIETPPAGKIDFHPRKNSLAILYRTRSLPTGDRLHQNGRNLPKKWKKLQNVRKKQYKHPTTNMPTPCVTSRSGTMSLYRTPLQQCGTYMG